MKKIILVMGLVLCMITTGALADMSHYEDVSRIVRENWRDTYVENVNIQVGSSKVTVDGEENIMKSEVKLENGNTLVPVAEFIQPFEAEFVLVENGFEIRQGTLVATGKAGSDELNLTFQKNPGLNKTVKLPCPVQDTDSVLYMPVRALVEDVFGGEVRWNDATKSVMIKRDYQTKRIIAKVKNSDAPIAAIECKEKITDGKGEWIIQFDSDTSDIEVKHYCDTLASDAENVEYAFPDVIASIDVAVDGPQ